MVFSLVKPLQTILFLVASSRFPALIFLGITVMAVLIEIIEACFKMRPHLAPWTERVERDYYA